MTVVSPRTDSARVSPGYVEESTGDDESAPHDIVGPSSEQPPQSVDALWEAEVLEKRGRRWIVISLILCPCHLPVTMAVLAAVFGGTWLGAAFQGRALQVGVVLAVLYALALRRAFGAIRRAKRLEASGGRLRCTQEGCEVTPS